MGQAPEETALKYVVDSWGWIEYFDAGPAGRSLKPVIESGEEATSVVTLAEISDRMHRDARQGTGELLAFVRSKTTLLDITPDIAAAAGKTKWAQRKRHVPMGLADAIIYETARAHGLTVLTGDPGFRGLPGVEFVRAE